MILSGVIIVELLQYFFNMSVFLANTKFQGHKLLSFFLNFHHHATDVSWASAHCLSGTVFRSIMDIKMNNTYTERGRYYYLCYVGGGSEAQRVSSSCKW